MSKGENERITERRLEITVEALEELLLKEGIIRGHGVIESVNLARLATDGIVEIIINKEQ